MTIISNARLAMPALAAGMAVLLILTGHAEARPSTKSFTCEDAREFVNQQGAVVMDTKSSRVYRRFVSNRSYCSAFELIEWHFVPTKSGSCSLKICEEPLGKDDKFKFGG
ncbi:MAG: hypothetical protein OXR62_08005 [Ahrensia sp.]|nr:hypothetical protein [Ahrensia sp.]